MKIDEVRVGVRVLAQTSSVIREHAQVKGINDGKVIVKLSDGNLTEIEPQYILKDFEV